MDNGVGILSLIIFLGLCFLAASTGSVFRPGLWYEHLAKPDWRPPNWLFPPVWSVLYGMMAVSGWLVWRRVGYSGVWSPLTLYAIQLLLNAAWSGLCFGLRRLDLALVDLILLWLAVVGTMVVFAAVHALAAWLLVPYLLWISFAGALNFAIWRMNRVAA